MPERDRDILDKELARQLRAMPVPAADERLEARIIQRAMAEGDGPHAVVQVHRGAGFSTWWDRPKLALAAAIAAVALLVLSPAEQPAGSSAPVQAAQSDDRYSVDGVPLLADVDVLEEEAYYELAYADLGGYNGY